MSALKIEGWPEAIPLGRETLLDAALAAGAPAPHQCRAGECGSCKCRLLKGEVRTLPHLPSALSEEERRDGWILSCRAMARSDVEIAFPEAPAEAPPIRRNLTGRVVERELTNDLARLSVALKQPLVFNAGQYVTLKVPGFPERSYSPANRPGESTLEFIVRIVPGGLVSQHIGGRLSPGDRVTISGPYGTACLTEAPERPLLLAGGGSGIAPMLSILRETAERAPDARCWFYIGTRTEADLLVKDALALLSARMPRLRIVPVFSEAAPEGGRFGFIGPAMAEDHALLSGVDIYAAGPPPMVESVAATAAALGADPAAIRSDPFTDAPRLDEAAPGPLRRLFTRLIG